MLKVENLFVEKSNRIILSNITFQTEEHKTLCVLGPSGCGKTTLLNSIIGFEEVSRGKIFDGERILSDGPENLISPFKRGFGVVFQDLNLFPHLSVRENIAYGLRGWEKEHIKQRVDELLKVFELTNCDLQNPGTLSGGERQRVAIARSLAPRPQTIFLDEPFSNLDGSTKRNLRVFLKKIFKEQKVNVFFITHDKEDAFHLADKVLILKNGMIEQYDTPRNIYQFPKSEFVSQFFGSQILFKHEGKLAYGIPEQISEILIGNCERPNSIGIKLIEKSFDSSGEIFTFAPIEVNRFESCERFSFHPPSEHYRNAFELNAQLTLVFKTIHYIS